jgi:hypothetical protein
VMNPAVNANGINNSNTAMSVILLRCFIVLPVKFIYKRWC